MKVLIVDDEKPLRDLLGPFVADLGHGVEQAATVAEGLEKAALFKPDLVLLDVNLPDGTGLDFFQKLNRSQTGASVVLITANVNVKTAVEAIKQGAEDYLAKPLDLEELEVILHQIEERRGLRQAVKALKGFQRELYGKDYLFLPDPQMQKVYEQIEQTASQPSVTTLILGETGTGKEHVAKLLHVLSARSGSPFVELHCGAMPENLLESELFGYEPGAFTDARKAKPGLFEMANGGTIFLDEVGELPLVVQTKLLKVLEQKTLRRLGGVRETKVDVRVVAATNRDLKLESKEGRFRPDLYYRLNVATIQLPPLRSRPADIKELAVFFLNDLCKVFNKKIRPLSEEFLDRLAAHSWPGNVRELKNVMERAVLYCKGDVLSLKDLPMELLAPASQGSSPAPMEGETGILSLEEAERENIRKVLGSLGNNRTKAARQLGISRTTLQSKIKKYELE